jgi:hypothetical protein
VLSSHAETVVAQPEFPDKAFRLRIDLSPESWDEVRKTLGEQDTFLKCGMALDPDTVMSRLKELGQSGFDVHLPRTLFRKIELPASVQPSVAVEDHHVSLDVRPNALRVTKDALWYSAAIRSRVTADHPAPPTPAPPHFRMPLRRPSP